MTTTPDQSPVCALLRGNVRAMKPYVPGEQINQALKLNTNECAWGPSPRVRQVLAAVADDSLRLYPDPSARALREAAARRWGVHADQVLVGNGSDDCLTIIYRALCNPEDHVAVPWPTYGLYDTLAQIQDVRIEHHDMQLQGDGAWSLPESLYGCGAKLVLIANPNNPSGNLLADEQQIRHLAQSLDHGMLVIDQAYADFIDPAIACRLEALLDELPNLILLRTFSKSASLAGARLGLLFAQAAIVSQLNKVKDSYNVNALTQAVGLAALEDTAYLDELVEKTLAARRDLERDLSPFAWRWPISESNFLLVEVGPDAERIYHELGSRGILVRWWASAELRNCLRITSGTPEQNRRLVAALHEITA